MPELSEIFGENKLSYEEFVLRAGERGAEFGDVAALRSQHAEELLALRRSAALERELDHAGARNRALLSRLVDLDAVEVDEEGVHGLQEQISALRSSDPYLFEGKSAETAGKSSLRSGMPHQAPAPDEDTLSDREFYTRMKKI